MGADISYARVRRPTDNAVTERFFGTVKQEEIHVVGSYPDEHSGRSEIGTYIDSYNTERPTSEPLEFHLLLFTRQTIIRFFLRYWHSSNTRRRSKSLWEGRTI